MKRNLITGILTTLTLLLLISVPSTYAQATIEATVPFNFMVGKAEMPAGTYTINRLSSSAIEIKGSTTKKSAVSMVWSEGASASDSDQTCTTNDETGVTGSSKVWTSGASETSSEASREACEEEGRGQEASGEGSGTGGRSQARSGERSESGAP